MQTAELERTRNLQDSMSLEAQGAYLCPKCDTVVSKQRQKYHEVQGCINKLKKKQEDEQRKEQKRRRVEDRRREKLLRKELKQKERRTAQNEELPHNAVGSTEGSFPLVSSSDNGCSTTAHGSQCRTNIVEMQGGGFKDQVRSRSLEGGEVDPSKVPRNFQTSFTSNETKQNKDHYNCRNVEGSNRSAERCNECSFGTSIDNLISNFLVHKKSSVIRTQYGLPGYLSPQNVDLLIKSVSTQDKQENPAKRLKVDTSGSFANIAYPSYPKKFKKQTNIQLFHHQISSLIEKYCPPMDQSTEKSTSHNVRTVQTCTTTTTTITSSSPKRKLSIEHTQETTTSSTNETITEEEEKYVIASLILSLK